MTPMRGNPPPHLVLEVLAALNRNPDQWHTADTLRGGTDRSAASIASSLVTAARHSLADRKPIGRCVYWRITGAGRAELRLAGQGRDDTQPNKSLGGVPAPTAPGDGPPRRSPGLPGATAIRGAQPPGPGAKTCGCDFTCCPHCSHWPQPHPGGVPDCDCGATMADGGMSSAHLNWCATLAHSDPRVVDHDPMCTMRRAPGHARCTCAHYDELAWLLAEIARRFPDGLDRLETAVAA